jgi:hypothetical protein
MPRGGARPGAGAPLGNRNNRSKRENPVSAFVARERPKFETGKDFALWALNAADDEVPMEVKVRAMQALVAAEAKAAAPKPADAQRADQEEGGIYAPRAVRGYGVVSGGRAA